MDTTPSKKPIPHDVVTEFIGMFSFSKNPEQDVNTAEQIASQTYTSMRTLYDTCKGFAIGKIVKWPSIVASPFFYPYIQSNP